MMRVVRLIPLLALLFGGCDGSSAVDMAAAPPDLCSLCNEPALTCDDTMVGDAGIPGTWRNVELIVDNNCTNGACHYACRPTLSGQGTDCFTVPGGMGLVLEHGLAYMNIVDKIAADPPNQCGGVIVKPFHPEQSYLLVKLTTPDDPACNQPIPPEVAGLPASTMQCNPQGGLMPRGEPFNCPLANCQIDLIRRWIQAGAPDADGGVPDADGGIPDGASRD
jgi:hypothetical protein